MSKMGGLHRHIEIAIVGEPPKFQFLLAYGPIKMAYCPKKKKNLGSSPFNE
jgi:hypothetical protein